MIDFQETLCDADAVEDHIAFVLFNSVPSVIAVSIMQSFEVVCLVIFRMYSTYVVSFLQRM
jgi:hypothetical protein